MTVDFNSLWAEVRRTENEAEAVRILARILSSKEGRAFASSLKPAEGVFCIEILDHVRSNPHLRNVRCTLTSVNLGSRGTQTSPI